MIIQVNSDKHVSVPDKFSSGIQQKLRQKLKYLTDHVTRIEVFLSDENSIKGGTEDKRCLLEVRIANMRPVSTAYYAETINQAITGATRQLADVIRNLIDRKKTTKR